MKRSIGILLGLALLAGAGLAQAGTGGGGHGGGSHAGGHPGTGGQHFTTGPTHFTTGPTHFTGARPGIRPGPVVIGRPGFPHNRVIVGGAIVVGAPFFWYPPYPYPYPPYAYPPYAYVDPAYGGSAYTEVPTYIEQGAIAYYCPDYQDYYPNVPSCPSPWMQVVPGPAPQ